MSIRDELDARLQYGPPMRVHRLVEAAFLLAAIFSGDIRFAYVTVALTVLQTIHPRLVIVALLVALFARAPKRHHLTDLYFDLHGSRGSSAISLVIEVAGLLLWFHGWKVAGLLSLALPAASLLMAPTLGFCAGCWFYVMGRDLLAKAGLVRRGVDGSADVKLDDVEQTRV